MFSNWKVIFLPSFSWNMNLKWYIFSSSNCLNVLIFLRKFDDCRCRPSHNKNLFDEWLAYLCPDFILTNFFKIICFITKFLILFLFFILGIWIFSDSIKATLVVQPASGFASFNLTDSKFNMLCLVTNSLETSSKVFNLTFWLNSKNTWSWYVIFYLSFFHLLFILFLFYYLGEGDEKFRHLFAVSTIFSELLFTDAGERPSLDVWSPTFYFIL